MAPINPGLPVKELTTCLGLIEATVIKIKEKSAANGDAKIDVGLDSQKVSGLTKEELMKYADDPFWVRLRWILFVLFWAIWIAMLVFAIVIIIRAPKCEPPPELLWIEEGSLVEIDRRNIPDKDMLIKTCKAQSASSVYFPSLINDENFGEANYDVYALIASLVEANLRVVTDMPSRISSANPLYQSFEKELLILSDGSLNYTNHNLSAAMFKNVGNPWAMKGVKGFLLPDEVTPDIQYFLGDLNMKLEEVEGSIAANIKEQSEVIGDQFDTSRFREFLEGETEEWSFYKFNPNNVATSSLSGDKLRLATIALYLFPGTPIYPYGNSSDATNKLLEGLVEFRTMDGIKFGETYFINATEDVIAYTRVYKGTPAYAVALNFGAGNETVSFKGSSNIADSGTMELYSTPENSLFDSRSKNDLSDVDLAPYEGKIMQFVANFK